MRTTSRRRPRTARGLAAAVAAAALLLVAPVAGANPPAGGGSGSSSVPSTSVGSTVVTKATPIVRSATTGSNSTAGTGGTARTARPTAGAATPKSSLKAADTVLAADGSLRMPKTAHDETVGDFSGKGFYQRAVVENGRLNIYNPPSMGGNVARSTPTDLVPGGPSGSNGNGGLLPLWQGGPISDLDTANRLASVYLYWTPDALYIAGEKNVGKNETFGVWLYKVAKDGSCASSTCALWSTQLKGRYNFYPPFTEWVEAVTSLAVGKIGTQTEVAVGMSMTSTSAAYPFDSDGVSIVSDPPLSPGFSFNFLGFGAPEPTQVSVTALAWDPAGSGLLAFGTTSPLHTINAVKVDPTGRNAVFTGYHYWDSLAGDDYSPSALSAAVTSRADGSLVAAFGMSDGTVKLWDPAVTSASLLATAPSLGTTAEPNAVDAVGFTDRIDGTSGLPDLVAVSSKGNTARVLRYTAATTFVPQAVQVKGGTVTDVGGIRLWYPGYKTGSMRIVNSPREAVTLNFASRPNAAYGCWFGPAFSDRLAFPTAPVNVAVQTTTSDFTIGGLTAGVGGDCAATDSTGQWSAYVVVAPTARPSDRTTAKMTLSRDGKATLTQVGGSVRLRLNRANTEKLPLGAWELTVDAPQVVGSPAVATATLRQLDPAGTARPVYRIDVSASSWPLPLVTPARISSVLPAMVVQGSTNGGGTWADLGRLIPQGQPTRSTTGLFTLAPASFYWQNPASGTAYNTFRLSVLGHVFATTLRMQDVQPPTDGAHVGQLTVCPTSSSGSCSGTAAPFANGLDEAPLKVQIYDDNGVVLPVSDPNYTRIYYRDDSGDLLTGLIPMDGSSYIKVSPYPGAYSNDGSAGSIVRPTPTAPVGGRFGYLSTTSTLFQEVTAHVGGSSESSDPIAVGALRLTPSVPAGSQAAVGFYATGCADYPGTSYCRLAGPVDGLPSLFMATDPVSGAPAIGLKLRTMAENAFTSLPLQQLAGEPEHNVAASLLNINNGEVTLDATSSFQPGDTIDAYLVTHGTFFQARAIKVGGGN